MEHLRAAEGGGLPLDDLLRRHGDEKFIAPEPADEARLRREKMLDCLERCVGDLEEPSQAIIKGYYFGEERVKIDNRRALAQKLGLSANALSIRACRIRDRLEVCVGKCAAETPDAR